MLVQLPLKLGLTEVIKKRINSIFFNIQLHKTWASTENKRHAKQKKISNLSKINISNKYRNIKINNYFTNINMSILLQKKKGEMNRLCTARS